MVKDKRFALVFRAVTLIFVIIGILSMIGVFRGTVYTGIFAYYTIQSNILAVVLFSMLTVRTIVTFRNEHVRHAGYFSRFEMVCVIDIMLTFFVYWTLLAPNLFKMTEEYSLWSFDNLAVHGITPLLCLADYILFSQPRHLKYRDVYCVIIYPLVYLALTSLAGLLGYIYQISPIDGAPVRFPYFFYDFDRIGAMSLIYTGALVVLFLIIAHCFYLFDTKIRKMRA
jgi:hypothetical protein